MKSPFLRFLLVLGIFLVPSFRVAAVCLRPADYMAVYPDAGAITRNPVFLVKYNEEDYKLAEKLDNFEFYLLVNRKRKVPVRVVQKVMGVGSETQLLVKPEALLRLNDSVQLLVNYRTANPHPPDLKVELFKFKLSGKKWHVASGKDREPVVWTGDITPEYRDMTNTSIGGHEVSFYYKIADSNPAVYKFGQGQQYELHLFEVEINGQKFYCVGGGPKNVFAIYDSDCGWNFGVRGNKNYEAAVTALDFSGNRSTGSQKITFNTFRQGKR